MSAAAQAVAKLNAGLASLSLAAERFGERRLWRAGRLARDAAALANEALVRAAHAAGVRECTTGGVEGAWRRPMRALPPYAGHEAPDRDALPGSIPAGVVPFPDGSLGRVDRLTFRGMPGGSPSMYRQFLFYSLDGVERLRASAERGGDASHLDAALALARRWCEACLYTERVPHVWDDHIAAVRTLALARLWSTLRSSRPDDVSRGDRALLAEAMARHARRLALPAFYRAEHNHGVTQACALLAVGALLPGHGESARWKKLGAERLGAQLRDNVTVPGLHREHSPFYHFYVLRQFLDAAAWAAAEGIPLSTKIESRCDAMLAAGAHLVKPDGALAALGDTNRASYALDPEAIPPAWSDSAGAAAFRYSASQGSAGWQPASGTLHDGDAGLLLHRSGWGAASFREARYLALRLATAPTTHIHRDVLSFEWQAFGADLVVDAGGPFGYGTPWRHDYFVRSVAHNTLTADDADQPVGRAAVRVVETSSSWLLVDASIDLGDGALHRRVLFAHDDGCLALFDAFEALRPRAWTLRLHLAPDLEAARSGGDVVATRVAGPGLRIAALGPDAGPFAVTRGSESPPQGWICGGDLVREPCTVVSRGQTGTRGSFVTVLQASRTGSPEPSQASVTTDSGGRTAIRIRCGASAYSIRFTRDAKASVVEEGAGDA